MREHRTIEKMVERLRNAVNSIESGKVDVDFFELSIDFLHSYADERHHGKEENILFRELTKKPMSDELIKIMNELKAEHLIARMCVSALREWKARYVRGDMNASSSIASNVRQLVQLYPRHIEKEDKRFFYPVLNYLSTQEQKEMLIEFYDFDKKTVLPRYEGFMEHFEPIPKGVELMQCTVCGYIYDPSKGDPGHGVKPNTIWEDLPDNWACPICSAPKSMFVKYMNN